MGKKFIQIKNVSKSFQSNQKCKHVLKNITFDVYENEFVVICGPGQCGKSTLINVIAGLLEADIGEVIVNDKIVSKPGPDRGVVFQNTLLFPWLSVMGNVEFGPKAMGENKKIRRARAQHFIDLVGLKGFEKTFPNKLSGGMKQRVGIARAYCIEPSVMLMDEPFGQLDAQTRYMMEEELERIWRTEKRTVIFVTNNIEEAVFLADRVILLDNGATGVAEEFIIELPRPRNNMSIEFVRLRKEIASAMDTTL